jgi:hypothetical protein
MTDSEHIWLLALNPMASLIECYRSSIFGTEHTEVQPAGLHVAQPRASPTVRSHS